MSKMLIKISTGALFFVSVLIVAISTPTYTSAHVAPLREIPIFLRTQLQVEGNVIQLDTQVPFKDAYVVPLTSDNKIAQKTAYTHFQNLFQDGFVIRNENQNCSFKLNQAEPSSDRVGMHFTGTFICPKRVTAIENLVIKNSLYVNTYPNAIHLVTIEVGLKTLRLDFRQAHDTYPTNVTANVIQSSFQKIFVIIQEFLWLGMVHIWTGYDHILFLLSVILLVRSLKKILLLITAFTVAHSITLLLASFYIVAISPRIVEPAIAFSIGYMALQNIFVVRKSETKTKDDPQEVGEKWMITFVFGLVHGFGFATALAETEVPAMFFTPSLIIFNIGIEIGQLVILALALPLLFYIDRVRYRKNILIMISGLFFALSAAWFFVRVFFGEECSSAVHYALLQIVCI